MEHPVNMDDLCVAQWIGDLHMGLHHANINLVGGLVAIFWHFPIYWECHHPN